MPILIVFAGNALSEQDYCDDAQREEYAARAERIIATANIAGIQNCFRLEAASLCVIGSEGGLLELMTLFKQQGIDSEMDDGKPSVMEAAEVG